MTDTGGSFGGAVARTLRGFDAFPKTLEDFRIKTFAGAAVTIISGVIMFSLFISELVYFLSPEVKTQLLVDTGREPKMRVYFDVIFSRWVCFLFSSAPVGRYLSTSLACLPST